MIVIIGVLAIIAIVVLVADLKEKQRAEDEFRRMQAAADAEFNEYVAEIASRPDPWLGMDESELSECNWTEHYTSYSETATKHGTTCCYFYKYEGYLHFANGKLISIVRTG